MGLGATPYPVLPNPSARRPPRRWTTVRSSWTRWRSCSPRPSCCSSAARSAARAGWRRRPSRRGARRAGRCTRPWCATRRPTLAASRSCWRRRTRHRPRPRRAWTRARSICWATRTACRVRPRPAAPEQAVTAAWRGAHAAQRFEPAASAQVCGTPCAPVKVTGVAQTKPPPARGLCYATFGVALLRRRRPPSACCTVCAPGAASARRARAGAWHQVRVRGRRRLLAPMLVTGCKVWHLRDEGVFYPKHAWLRTVAALPDGAQARPRRVPGVRAEAGGQPAAARASTPWPRRAVSRVRAAVRGRRGVRQARSHDCAGGQLTGLPRDAFVPAGRAGAPLTAAPRARSRGQRARKRWGRVRAFGLWRRWCSCWTGFRVRVGRRRR
jgi:hypothetical protein